MLETILLFLVLLSVLVFVHELGHFFVARRMGMKVEEFGFGFPPRMFGVRRGETTYSVNWIPVGGFVRIKGESGEHREDHDSFVSKSPWRRFLVLVAGVVMNLVLAAVLLWIGFLSGLPSVVSGSLPESARVRDEAIRVVQVVPGSAADLSGIKVGDRLLSVDDRVFEGADDARAHLLQADGSVRLLLERGDERFEKTVTKTALENGEPQVGVALVRTGLVSYGPLEAVWRSIEATGGLTIQVVVAFADVIVDLVTVGRPEVELAGPVGIAVMTSEVASLGFAFLLQFAAVLSINLAVINALPFPALDGGRILFLAMEKLRGRPVRGQTEALAHNLGFLFLIGLVILVTYHDLARYGGDMIVFFRNLL